MALGSYACGIGPCGMDPPLAIDRISPTLPPAPKYDPALHAHPLNANGELVAVHPVDQAVALALHIPLGSIQSAPGTGIDYAKLKRASRLALQQTVNDVVQVALATLISEGDIKLIGSPLIPGSGGKPFFYVDYVNLRLPTNQTAVLRATVR